MTMETNSSNVTYYTIYENLYRVRLDGSYDWYNDNIKSWQSGIRSTWRERHEGYPAKDVISLTEEDAFIHLLKR